jgi:hypothetical protein
VNQFLVKELSTDLSMGAAEETTFAMVLKDIEFIFDIHQTREARLLRADLLEKKYDALDYPLFQQKWNSELPERPKWRDWWPTVRHRFRQGMFMHRVSAFTDFLQEIAREPNLQRQKELQFAASDYMMQIFRHQYLLLNEPRKSTKSKQHEEFVEKLNRSNQTLKDGIPWADRTVRKRGWVPFFRKLRCEDV